MSDREDIVWNEMQRLFSVFISFDESMRIVFASDTVHSYLPEVKNHPRMNEVFNVLRPGKLQTFSDVTDSLESLCLMTAINGRFAVRGQFVVSNFNGQKVVCLCGSPWLFWMSNNCPDIRLNLGDFAAQDVQLDQLLFMTTEKKMVEDLEKLATELTETRNSLEEAHDAQHRFFAQMSHEMRTPLNGVVSALSLLECDSLDEKQQLLVSLARSSSRNLMDVINYVLDLSKLGLAGEEGDSIFDLPELLRATLDITGAKAKEKSLEVALKISPGVPHCCRGNASHLRQTLLNLIMNAIKFTAEGAVTIEVEKVAGEGSSCTLKFSVTDTGIGVASDLREKIFEPFWSSQPEGRDHPDAGTGLGLDIVRRNVEYMGGRVGLVSELGVGSTFWFDWPTTAESALSVAGMKVEKKQTADSDIELSGRILLVDDNETNLLLGGMIVESMGIEVSTARNGTEAVAAALNDDYDLVLMDIHMPDFDGIEATRRIRKVKDPRMLPIVALTALAYDNEKENCIENGMNGYLTKPIVRQTLANELGKWLSPNVEFLSAKKGKNSKIDENASHADIEFLDNDVLEELKRQIGADNLEIVLGKVVAEASQRWTDLIIANDGGDAAGIQRNVHSLSSIFRSVGLMYVGDALAVIEGQLRTGKKVRDGWLQELEISKTESLKRLEQKLAEH
ncbi:MAG: response regulator [Halioglobus sp.]